MHVELDADRIRHIARLARLRVKDDQIPPLLGDCRQILALFRQLDDVDVTDVSPCTHAHAATLCVRDDDPASWPGADGVLKDAPRTADACFIVPRVLDGGRS
jgi:aspartyl-tRNA(Asn)/glutamyl-tRNA(Gln) amidotransferase subunit C